MAERESLPFRADRDDFAGYVCMVYDEHGNATEGFDFTPEELDLTAKALRMVLGEVTTVTTDAHPFITGNGSEHRG